MSEPVLDLSSLRGAIASLEGALEAVGDRTWFDGQSPNVQNTLMAGAIQNFEFVHELSIKMIRRQIELGSDSMSVLVPTITRRPGKSIAIRRRS